MSEKVSLSFRDRNPDVLTSIANLSNDEVFTPPSLAVEMMDSLESSWRSIYGTDIWQDETIKILDPFTKSGVFLREATRRFVDGLEAKIPDLQERVDHVLTKQIFGIAITELTANISRRSLYCSKLANSKHSICTKFGANENGNVKFWRTEHTWSGGQIRELRTGQDGVTSERFVDGKCIFCGANQRDYDRSQELESHAYPFTHTTEPIRMLNEIFGDDVKFDVVVGNPPYQLSTGGGNQTKQAKPIYQDFIRQAMSLEPNLLCMVVPSRWFAGGLGLDSFRSDMMKDRSILRIVDYPDAREVFGDQGPAGGVNYFLWSPAHNGPCDFSTVKAGDEVSRKTRYLDEYEVIIRDALSLSIIEQVATLNESPLKEIVSAISPFGLSTAFRGAESRANLTNPVAVRSTGGLSWIERSEIKKNADEIDRWKVLLSATASEHAGQPDKNGTRRIFSRIEILKPGEVVTHSYLTLGSFAEEQSAINLASYLKTKFVRYLVSVVQSTQHLSRATFSFVPLQDFSKGWADADLNLKYKLSPEQIQQISNEIRSMDQVDDEV